MLDSCVYQLSPSILSEFMKGCNHGSKVGLFVFVNVLVKYHLAYIVQRVMFFLTAFGRHLVYGPQNLSSSFFVTRFQLSEVIWQFVSDPRNIVGRKLLFARKTLQVKFELVTY